MEAEQQALLPVRTVNPKLGKFSNLRSGFSRHASFQLLKYEKEHRNVLAGTEFIAGILGGYSLASLFDAITLDVPPDDPSKIGLLAAFPIALAFAYASASIHASFNESFEDVGNIYEFIHGLLDESPDLTDEECFEWINAIFQSVVPDSYDRYKHRPLLEFYDLIDSKKIKQINLTLFIHNSRQLVNDFKFREIFEALKEIATEGPLTAQERYDRIITLNAQIISKREYSKVIMDNIINPMTSIIHTKTAGNISVEDCIAQFSTLFTDPNLFLNRDQNNQNHRPGRRSPCNKGLLAIKLGLDYGDHTVNTAQTLVQPLNVFEGLPPRWKKGLIGGFFGLAACGTYGDWYPCLVASGYSEDRPRGTTNNRWIILSTVVGGIAVSAATWSNFSGWIDAAIGATNADKTLMWNSTTLPGMIGGCAMAALTAPAYVAEQTAVNVVAANPIDPRDIEAAELTPKQSAMRMLIVLLSLLARAEIYRSEIFEPIDQTLDAYMSRSVKNSLYFFSLFMLYMIVAPEVRGGYYAVGKLFQRHGLLGNQRQANNQQLARVAAAGSAVAAQAVGANPFDP